jgi:L-iditol 2-dehydrogenase
LKAAVYYGPRDVRIETVATPTAGAGEAVLRVLRCSVCGTDKRIYTHGQKNVVPPTVTGHEIVGTVAEIGSGVEGLALGQRVIVATVIGCGKCIYCQRKQYNLCESFTALGYDYAGGFAEYVKIPAAAVAQGNIIFVPAEMSLERAALVEPLSCCLNGQEYLNAQPGDRGLVLGAGPIGMMHAAILKARGCSLVVVTDVSDERLSYVEEFGLGEVVNTAGAPDAAAKILEAVGGEKFDVALTANSVKSTQSDALKLVRKKGRVCFFAGIPKDDPIVPIDTNFIHYQEISVFGCFASNLNHYHEALAMVGRDDLPWDRFLTHRFKLDQMVQAFALVEKGQGIKMVIDCE